MLMEQQFVVALLLLARRAWVVVVVALMLLARRVWVVVVVALLAAAVVLLTARLLDAVLC